VVQGVEREHARDAIAGPAAQRLKGRIEGRRGTRDAILVASQCELPKPWLVCG
jgi:hypothetical protein